MKLKKEYLILVLIIVVLSVYLGTRSKDQTHFNLPQPAEVDSQKINRLVIAKGDQSIELSKKDDQWYIDPKGYLADSIKVKNMVKAAADLAITDLISESGNYERYDLADDQKINVRAFVDNQTARNFDLGKGAPTNQHTFARLADDPNVYHARGRLDTTFGHTAEELRDLTVLSFEKNDITALAIQKGAQSVTLAKKTVGPEEKAPPDKAEGQAEQKEAPAQPQTQWQDADGKAVDQPTVQRLLGDFSNLKCSRFLEDSAAENLKANAPTWTLTFRSEKETYSLSAFDKPDADAAEFEALSSAGPYAFTLTKSKFETIEKQMDKLLGQESKTE